MPSLKGAHHKLSDPRRQTRLLNRLVGNLPRFEERLDEIGLYPLIPTHIDVLQVNIGKMCNQACTHCHVDAGPDRDEIMSRETMEYCLVAIEQARIATVDVTGGAPEMNPHFRWFIEEISKRGSHIIVRTNLTILTVSPYRQLPQFLAKHRVTLMASLPCYTAENTNRQRGNRVFEKSIEALRRLNDVGYAREGSGLELHLVYNPLGASLPPPQRDLEANYKRILKEDFNVVFNRLYCITNMPISRFLEYLLRTGRYEAYMRMLVKAFNPVAAAGLMCRSMISVGWDGTLYDCDFNQMLGLKLEFSAPQSIRDFDAHRLASRRVVLNQHCYGCTAGAGSSCGGEIVG